MYCHIRKKSSGRYFQKLSPNSRSSWILFGNYFNELITNDTDLLTVKFPSNRFSLKRAATAHLYQKFKKKEEIEEDLLWLSLLKCVMTLPVMCGETEGQK